MSRNLHKKKRQQKQTHKTLFITALLDKGNKNEHSYMFKSQNYVQGFINNKQKIIKS